MFIVVNKVAFSEWLQEILQERGLSQAEVARRGKISSATVSMLVTGQNQPSGRTCLALARALDLPAETVLKAAGILAELPAPGSDPTIGEISDVLKRMTAEERQEILEYVLWRFRRKGGG